MALLSDLIYDAYREANTIAIVADPSDNELAEGLDRLNTLFVSALGAEVGLELKDLNIGGQYDQSSVIASFVPENVRLVLNLQNNATYRLHPQPYDGQRVQIVDGNNTVGTYTVTLDANGRKIEGASSQLIEATEDLGQFFYRADLGDWVRMSDLGEDDECPFPTEFDDYFVIKLAMRFCGRHGNSLKPESLARYEEARSQLAARYRRPRDIQDMPTLGLLGQGESYDIGWNPLR